MQSTPITQAELASVFGVSLGEVKRLVPLGLPKSGEHYDLSECCRWYISVLRARMDSAEVMSHRERLTAAQADLAEFELEKSTGEWAPIADVKQLWGTTLAGLRQGLLGLPSKIMQAHPNLQPDVFDTATREVRTLLSDLSTADTGTNAKGTKKLAHRKRGRPRKSDTRHA